MENQVKNQKANIVNKNLAKGKQATVQSKPDSKRVTMVTPANDSGKPGPSSEESSNVGQGPAGENL
jgi:hypothetical protein